MNVHFRNMRKLSMLVPFLLQQQIVRGLEPNKSDFSCFLIPVCVHCKRIVRKADITVS